MMRYPDFFIRNATTDDLNLLLELEKKWPEESRASAVSLRERIEKFSEGFFIAENGTSILGSIIAHPYCYNPLDLSNYKNWSTLVDHCYSKNAFISNPNALYIISGTSCNPYVERNFFKMGVDLIQGLACQMNLPYVVAGALLPGYRHYLERNPWISAVTYVFQKNGQRYVDPLIEKYRRMGFFVPDECHVIPDYFPDQQSLNYSALVVKKVIQG